PREGWRSDAEIAAIVDDKRGYLDEVIAMGSHRTSETNLAKYVVRCKKYISALGNSLTANRTRQFGGKYALKFELENEGNAPALDVNLDLSFPAEWFVLGS